MKIEERTLENLRNALSGKIYLYLKDRITERLFAVAAEEEGYRFGTIVPTESPADNLIALDENKQLSHVGFVGRFAFQCNGGNGAKGRFHRIDYAKYVRGDADYYYRKDNGTVNGVSIQCAEAGGRFSDNGKCSREDLSPDKVDVKKNRHRYADIWMCSLPLKNGSVMTGYRPVYIASNDINNKNSTTVNVIPLTSKKKKYMPIHVYLERKPENGLSFDSILLVEQMTTVSVSSLDRKIGRITDDKTLQEISWAMSIQFPDYGYLQHT